jgi:exopolysaccharide biosynthesis polyprenyl glycosylphosphotransferase
MVKRHIAWLFVTITVLVDALLIGMSFNVAWWLRYRLQIGGHVAESNFVPLATYSVMRLAMVGVMLLVFTASGIYRMPRGRRFLIEATQLVNAILAALGLVVIALFLVRVPLSSRLLLGYAGVIVTLLLLASRLCARLVKQVFWRRGIGVIRVLVVGDGTAARDLMRSLLAHPNDGRRLWGCLAVDPQQTRDAILIDAGRPKVVPVLGRVDELESVMSAQNIRQVVIALPGHMSEATERVVRACARRHVDFRLAPELYGIGAAQVTVDDTFGRPVLNIQDTGLIGQRQIMKRILDITLSIIALVPFGLLVMLVIAVLIKLDSRGPVLFRQRRMTRDGSIFWVYKFRTMRVNAEAELKRLQAKNEASGPIFKMKDDPRLTRVGKWLRRASLDELPQIFNILLGEMSWVGPRPPLPSEVELYEDWQKRRLGTLTGLTGLWQVSGRSLLPFEEMVKLDLYYVENWSVWLDLKILFMTIPSVLKGKGAY